MNIIIFGAPGSGKGTQSDRIVEEFGLYHISTGELLRKHIATGTHLGKVADSYISQGQLIPDELMIDVLSDLFGQHPEHIAGGVIFDGFPRTIAQAEALSEMLGEYGTEVHAVVGLDVDEDELVRRMILRGKESGRADDTLDTIVKRLQVYHKQTAPLREYYTDKGAFHPIDGNGSVDEIYESIRRELLPYKDKK